MSSTLHVHFTQQLSTAHKTQILFKLTSFP